MLYYHVCARVLIYSRLAVNYRPRGRFNMETLSVALQNGRNADYLFGGVVGDDIALNNGTVNNQAADTLLRVIRIADFDDIGNAAEGPCQRKARHGGRDTGINHQTVVLRLHTQDCL